MPSPTSNVAIAYRKLKQAILENQLAPGAQLLEQEAATQLEMSRTPVREAMLMLQKDGLVEMRPRQGMRVLPVTVQDINDIYEILEVIEGLAIKKLAASEQRDEIARTLEDAVVLMDLATDRGDLEVWASADKTFHESIMTLSGNAHLTQVFKQLWDRSQRARNMLLKRNGTPANSNDDHRAIIELIRAGKPSDAAMKQQELRRVAADKLRAVVIETLGGETLAH